MITIDERLTGLENKIDDVLEIISPKEKQTEPVTNDTIAEKIEELQSKMVVDGANILEFIRKSEFIRKCDESISNEEYESEADTKFNTRRNIFMLAALLIIGGLTLVFWFNYLPLFAICFGVFFGFGFQALVLVFDEFTLQGNSLKRISHNAVSSAIYLLVVAFSIWSGVQVGNSLVNDRSTVEEYRPPTATERQHTETRTETQSEPSIGESEE